MSRLKIDNIADWDYPELKEWLKQDTASTDEGWSVEFKKEFYKGKGSGKECRKDFSGMANSEGGYIIFGVEDGAKKITGIKKIDFQTKVSDLLSPACLDPEIDWELINKLSIPRTKSKRYVYVVRISKTFPFWKRPHISDGKIYVRKKGKTEPVKTLNELRERFFQKSNFVPEDIKYLDRVINAFVESDYEISRIDIFFVKLWQGLAEYLYLTDEETRNFEEDKILLSSELKSLYEEIGELFKECERLKASESAITGLPGLKDNNEELKEMYRQINEKLVKFKIKFEKYVK